MHYFLTSQLMKKLLLLPVFLLFCFSAVQAQWSMHAPGVPITNKVHGVSIVNQNITWAYTDTTIIRTINGGLSWATTSSATNRVPNQPFFYRVYSLHAVDALTAYILTVRYAGHGNYIRFYKTTDGGVTWTRQASAYPNEARIGTTSLADFIHFFDPQNGLIFGDKDSGYFEIYTTTDGGQNWNRIPAANLPAPTNYDFSTPGHVYEVIGDTIWVGIGNARILRSVDKGYHWTVASTGIPTSSYYGSVVKGIAFSNARNGLISYSENANDNPVLKRTTDGGLTWITVNYSGPLGQHDLAAIPGISGGYISAGGGSNRLGSSFTYDSGNTWTSLETTLKHYDIEFINNTTGWTTSDGVLYKYSAGALNTPKERSDRSEFTIAPNPSSGFFRISAAAREPYSVEVYNAAGGKILAKIARPLGSTSLDLSSYPKGIYLLKINSGKEQLTYKLVRL